MKGGSNIGIECEKKTSSLTVTKKDEMVTIYVHLTIDRTIDGATEKDRFNLEESRQS